MTEMWWEVLCSAYHQHTKVSGGLAHKFTFQWHPVSVQYMGNEWRVLSPSVYNDFAAAPSEVSNIAELARLMGKVEEMRSQRQELLAELRLSIQNDDITKKVLAASDEDLDNMFQKELDKHGSLLDLLEQNMSAQENIIGALTAVVEKLADLRARLVTTDMRYLDGDQESQRIFFKHMCGSSIPVKFCLSTTNLPQLVVGIFMY